MFIETSANHRPRVSSNCGWKPTTETRPGLSASEKSRSCSAKPTKLWEKKSGAPPSASVCQIGSIPHWVKKGLNLSRDTVSSEPFAKLQSVTPSNSPSPDENHGLRK